MKIRVFSGYGAHKGRGKKRGRRTAKRVCKFGRVKSGPRKGRCRKVRRRARR